MKKSTYAIALGVASWLILWGMGAWAFVFYMVMRDGEVVVREPNMTVLITEFAVAFVGALIGLAYLGQSIYSLKRPRGKESTE